ncbi:hypothetical protein GCM10025776_01630 [Corallincola platygyrae]
MEKGSTEIPKRDRDREAERCFTNIVIGAKYTYLGAYKITKQPINLELLMVIKGDYHDAKARPSLLHQCVCWWTLVPL